MSWYILGYNNRKSSSVYTGRLGCDVIFLLFLSAPLTSPPTSPLPLTSLIDLLPQIKILQGGNTGGGKREVGKGGRKAWFKRMIPPCINTEHNSPPSTTHNSANRSLKLGLLRHWRMHLSKLQK